MTDSHSTGNNVVQDLAKAKLTLRLARATVLSLSGQVFVRIDCYFEGPPYDFVEAHSAGPVRRAEIVERFKTTARPCCLRPWFCRRIKKRLETNPTALEEPAFWTMIDFWANNGEVVTTVRNERQHTRFNQALLARKKTGARPKVIRVLSQSLTSTLRDDHATLYRDAVAVKKKALRASKARLKHRPLRELKKAAGSLRRQRRSVTRFSLGTGRTPQLHYINVNVKRAKAEKLREAGGRKRFRIPRPEFVELRAQFAHDWAALPDAEREPYKLAVQKAREDRTLEARSPVDETKSDRGCCSLRWPFVVIW